MAIDIGEGVITILPDLKKFAPMLNAKLNPIMRTVTSGTGLMTLGFVAAGAASLKMAADFQDSMTRIRALVGISASGVAQLGQQVLDLAKTVPVGPVELADALYYVTSAGLRGAEAMSVLRDSAEASAAGLGQTKEIADLLTSAMNSYAQSGLTATRATDILIAAVREGKTDPAKFATSLGQVLPVAAQMGVTFDQVAAAIASSTRQGFFASRAAIGLRYLIASFIRPSADATEALNSIGFSIEALQEELRSKGLLFTLRDLADKLNLDTAAGKKAFATIVGGVRGMSTAAILIGENSKAITGVFNDVKNSAGSLANATEAAQQRMSYQWGTLVNNVRVAAIKFGTVLLPIATDVVKIFQALFTPVAKVLELFEKMPGVVTTAVAAFLGFRLISGILPAVATGLSMMANWLFQIQSFSKATALSIYGFSNAIRGSAMALAAWGAAIALAVIAAQKLRDYLNQDNEASANWTQNILNGNATLGQYRKAIDGLAGAHGGLGGIINGNAKVEQAYTETAQAVNKAISEQYGNLTKINSAWGGYATGARDSTNDNLQLNTTFAQLLRMSVATGDSLDKHQAKLVRDAVAAGNLSKGIKILGDFLGYTTKQTNDFVQSGGTFTGNVEKMKSTVAGLAVLTGGSFESIAQQAHDVFVSDFNKFGDNWDKFIGNIGEELGKFRDEAAKNLDFIGTDFQAMAQRVDAAGNPIAMTAQSILGAFRKAAADTKAFGKNLLEIADIAGGKGKALSAWLLSLGPDGAQAASIIAGASKKTQEQIATTFSAAQSASTDLANKLTRKIVGTLQNIESILMQLAQGWKIPVNVNVRGQNELQATYDKIHLIAKDWYVGINIHTAPISPWPDEALKMHLFDPLKKAGFKQTSEGWILRAGVNVHTASDIAGRARVPALNGSRPGRDGRSTLNIHLDRRRFSDELAYDAVYRGWD